MRTAGAGRVGPQRPAIGLGVAQGPPDRDGDGRPRDQVLEGLVAAEHGAGDGHVGPQCQGLVEADRAPQVEERVSQPVAAAQDRYPARLFDHEEELREAGGAGHVNGVVELADLLQGEAAGAVLGARDRPRGSLG